MAAKKQTIIDLEKRFWDSIKEGDVETGQSLIAVESVVSGPSGTMVIDPDKYGELMREGHWTLDKYQMRDVDVIFPSDDVAVIAYTIHETGEMEGKPMAMDAADSTTWVREGRQWKCVAHTETMLQPQKG